MFLNKCLIFILFCALTGCLSDHKNKITDVSKEVAVAGDQKIENFESTQKVESPKLQNENKTPKNQIAEHLDDETYKLCKKKIFDSKYQKLNAIKLCKRMQLRKECLSVKKDPIFHYEKLAKDPEKAKKILVISLIHGDEVPSGQISYSWIQRLINLDSRNTWRVIPMANPDGYFKRTRMNANGVDINRNFPTKDWGELALKRWKNIRKSDPRKFPGDDSNNQPETQCLVNHIDDFKPDFIISIHTPLGVLDFDGPKNIKLPKFKPLPWISLGNYPGSLGRYMWKERRVPVMTIELNNELAVYNLEKFDKLQDISGTVAIQSFKRNQKKSEKKQ